MASVHRNTILIVDDEEYICSDIREYILEPNGYQVVTACNIRKATEIIESKLPLLAAIIDLSLGDDDEKANKYSGIDMFIHLVKIYPYITIIVLSGHSINTITETVKYDKKLCSTLKDCYIKKGSLDEMERDILQKLKYWYGNYHALLIAAQEYRKDSGYSTLDYPVKDIAKIKDILTEDYIFCKDNVYTLINPSRENIIRKLCRLSEELNENDNLLIFYAGHGKKDAKNQKGYWIPCDAGNSAPQNWMSNADVVNWIARIKAKHKLMISDSCFSGTFAYTNREEQKSDDYKEIYKCDSFKFLSSANDNQTALDESIFLDCFLNYLKNTERRIFSAYDIVSDIAQKVEHRTKGIGKEQSIQYRKLSTANHDNEELNDDGHFLFIKKINEGA